MLSEKGGVNVNHSEIMKCAAILAAGIMANQSTINSYNAERAVNLMKEIAGILRGQNSEQEIVYPEI